MATTTLTPRQAEIKALLDKGEKPAQIAKRLKITDNAVYQQMRRMRQSGAKASTAKRSTGAKASNVTPIRSRQGSSAKRSSGRKPAAKRSTPVQRPAPVTVRHPVTPLEAIQLRRADIESDLKDTAEALEVAQAELTAATEAHEKATAAHTDELRQLDIAEAALTGKAIPPPANGSGSKQRARQAAAKTAPAPVAPTPEPTPAPVAPTPEPEPVAVAATQAEDEGDGLVGEDAPDALIGEQDAAAEGGDFVGQDGEDAFS